MTKYQWPESLLLMQELIMFFQVKDVNFEQDDIIINEAGESVPTHFSLPNIRRTKINIEDFNEIYEREFQKKQIEDTPEKRHLFREELVNHVQSKIGIYKLSIKDMNQNTDLVDIANNFIEFIGNMDKPEIPKNILHPKINENIIEDLYAQLNNYFEPKDQFMNFLSGNLIEGKINFLGDQNKLAGIFIDLKLAEDIKTGTREQTFDFIKQTFLIKGEPIKSKMILVYLNDPSKANKNTFIDISI